MNIYMVYKWMSSTHLHGLQMDVIDNRNITSNELSKGGLHLNSRG